MGKLYSLISALLLAVEVAYAADPTGYEWWFDNDVSTLKTETLPGNTVDFQIDTSKLPKGIHYFNLRLSSSEGGYGTIYRKMFHSFGQDYGAISYEYWIDNDYASKVAGDMAVGSNSIDLDVASLPKGIHYFNCRVGYGDGEWGPAYRRMFHSLGDDQNAISYEYWFDNDYASKIAGDMAVGSNSLLLDISSLPVGVHYFNCRVGYSDGEWGSIYRKMVLNLTGNVNAVAYEYWIDNDYESKTEGAISYGENSYVVDLEGIRKGLHRFNYRIQSGGGEWGSVYSTYFYAVSNELGATEYEYWLDNDFENRISASITGNPITFDIDLDGFDKSGIHYFNLRTRDDDGDWGAIYRKLIIFNHGDKRVPVLGYRQILNGTDYGYVSVEKEFVDSYEFEMDLPESLRLSVKDKKAIFDGDKVTIGGNDSIKYSIQIKTELGWAPPVDWDFEISTEFSATAVAIPVNSKKSFSTPALGEFVAVKFTSAGTPLYLRTDIPIDLDIYREGEIHTQVSASELKGMTMLELEAGEYFGILRDAEVSDATEFTFHLMDTPNSVPIPKIEFAGGMVTITCSRTDAEIRYAFDEEELTEESTLYKEPFALTRNAVVKARAYVLGSDIEPSDIATLTVDSYKTATPEGVFDSEARLLTLTCETQGAAISYSFDSTDWTPYENPIEIRRNRTVYAKATFDGYHDSEIAVISITELPDGIPTPEISFEDGMVTITCANADAEIHYTLDETEPTMESELYTESFSMTRNGVVRAKAWMPNLDIEPSDIARLVIDSYRTAAPTGDFDPETRLLTLNCSTNGATISYSFSADGEWEVYADPIKIRGNCTVYAKASFEGYNDSEVSEIEITGLPDIMPTPEISFENGMVNITCSRSDAEIHYTLDENEEPTMESEKFNKPFPLGYNATIQAIAFLPDSDIEPSMIAKLTVDSYKTATPYGDCDAATRYLTIHCDTEGASISYSLDPDGEWTEYTAPVKLDRNGTVHARASYPGYNDSETAEIEISELKCAPVTISYHGRYATLETEEPDAAIRYSLDGSNPSEGLIYSTEVDVMGLCHIYAVTVKDGLNDSEIKDLEIQCYADEQHAETAVGGVLESCYEWSGSDLPNSLESIRIEGILNDADYEFIRSMASLRHLDIEKVADAQIPDRALMNTGLVSVSMPSEITEYGEGILSENTKLSALIWNSTAEDLGTWLTEDIDNPNLLIYVNPGIGVEDSRFVNVIEADRASSVTLHHGHPFYAPRDFRADKVSLTREFDQNTTVGTCGGWETLVLPFTPDAITHETSGPITPFAAWDGDIAGMKPFWLYSANSDGWDEAESIMACVPYIISMPNNPDYVESFNLAGKVTFSAENVDFGPESSVPESFPWRDGTEFEGTFMPVEEEGFLSLNVNGEGDAPTGSMFVAEATTQPFGAYVRNAGTRRAMPVFGDIDGVTLTSVSSYGLTVETPSPGMIRISSNRDRKVDITTATGVKVRTLHLAAGETVTVEGLTRDLYICGGIKVMVK